MKPWHSIIYMVAVATVVVVVAGCVALAHGAPRYESPDLPEPVLPSIQTEVYGNPVPSEVYAP
ncbi:hypothetical protein [Paenibacillus apiarius]|uniref:hypothetical protein n=1 Tax=Paenibacillus apiarius TaxID=46240 RepID=UPI00197F82DB|nr:hypothetical protein [Paenibacillus apiarius]MBN3526001.1 hypothetical protein [Paenibacillus apiarius]